MLNIGKSSIFQVNEIHQSHLILIDSENNTVKMPIGLAPENVEEGDELEAFVHTDPNGEIIATAEIPYAQVDELAFLRVVKTTSFGAFLDWGLRTKDLLIPSNQQKRQLQEGDSVLVKISLDTSTNKIYATAKFSKMLRNGDAPFLVNQEVSIVPYEKVMLGYHVIVEKKYLGMIYDNEIFRTIEFGDLIPAKIKKVRDDGLIDISLQSLGMTNLRDASFIILDYLKENDGTLPLHDKSSPTEIKDILNMSKQSFKRAIGILYKEKKIILNKDSIQLNIK